MDYFSEEYRQKLISEHKLIKASLHRLMGNFEYGGYAGLKMNAHGQAAMEAAISQLRADQIMLEAKIDTLTEYLN